MVAAPPPPVHLAGGKEDERGPDAFQNPKGDPWNGDANMEAMSKRMGKLEDMLAKALEALDQRPNNHSYARGSKYKYKYYSTTGTH